MADLGKQRGGALYGGRPRGSEEATITARRADEIHDLRGQHFRPYHQTMNVIWQMWDALLWLGGWHCANDWDLLQQKTSSSW